MKISEAKKNIMKNFRANYTNDHQQIHDIEVFLLNAMENLELCITQNNNRLRDKIEEAVVNLERDYLKGEVQKRIDKIQVPLKGKELTDGECGMVAAYENVIKIIERKI